MKIDVRYLVCSMGGTLRSSEYFLLALAVACSLCSSRADPELDCYQGSRGFGQWRHGTSQRELYFGDGTGPPSCVSCLGR